MSLFGWLASLVIQGKPLASGYYSRHPETRQYNKDTKTKIGEKSTQTGEYLANIFKKSEGMGHASDLK